MSHNRKRNGRRKRRGTKNPNADPVMFGLKQEGFDRRTKTGTEAALRGRNFHASFLIR